ncbi:hypothetical protein OAH18_03040 [bacterium]|nr:hypothetical protein [bacterium]
MNPQSVIDESRPMLTEFLCDVGLHQDSDNLDLARVRDPFSAWVEQQTVTDDDRFYLASRLGAFICEYLIDCHNAERAIVENRIVVRMLVDDTIAREFEPYPIAIGIADKKQTLTLFLAELCGQ